MRRCASACCLARYLHSGGGCSLIKMAPCLAYDFCPPPPQPCGVGPFSGRHSVAANGSFDHASLQAHEPEHLKASGCWGSLKLPGSPAKMALSAEDKYRFALRVIGFACTTFYVFIYGAAPESKQCIRIHPAALHETATRYPYAIAATARSQRVRVRRRPLLLRRQGRLRVVAGALRRAGQHNFRI